MMRSLFAEPVAAQVTRPSFFKQRERDCLELRLKTAESTDVQPKKRRVTSHSVTH